MATTAAERAEGDSFDEVFGTAISRAVRSAVDDVGRDPLAAIGNGHAYGHAPPRPTGVGGGAGAAEAAEAPEVAETDDADDTVPLPVASNPDVDPYELLGVTRAASWEEITAAYRRLARSWHPDGADAAEAELRQDLIRDLNTAYAELRVRRGR